MFMDTRSTFRVDALDSGSMSIIALHGELDVSVQQTLMAEIDRVLAKRPVVLAIDLRGLTFMDSSGVHALISTGLRCQEQGQRFFVIRGGGHIDRVLNACGLDGLLRDGQRARSAARRRVHAQLRALSPRRPAVVHSDRGGADLGRVPSPARATRANGC